MSLIQDFRAAIALAESAISLITEERAGETYRESGWTRKELLGHLIDSAAHNHIRILTAATTGSLRLTDYDQRGCVALHGYAQMTWSDLASHWRSQNELIARVIERLNESQLSESLVELIRDYLRHLAHHIGQISGAPS